MRMVKILLGFALVLSFQAQPSWKRRYRYAKLGQTWKESQPGGRERATCRLR